MHQNQPVPAKTHKKLLVPEPQEPTTIRTRSHLCPSSVCRAWTLFAHTMFSVIANKEKVGGRAGSHILPEQTKQEQQQWPAELSKEELQRENELLKCEIATLRAEKALALAVGSKETNDYVEISVPLPHDSTGLVIGAGGRTMRILQEITGCVLWVDTTCEEAHNVLLSSAKHESLEMAARMILDVAEQRTSYDDLVRQLRGSTEHDPLRYIHCSTPLSSHFYVSVRADAVGPLPRWESWGSGP